MEKSLVVSVRLTREELEYLASGSHLKGTTLSEKIRELIALAKRSEESDKSYALLRDRAEEQFKPVTRRIQQREFESGARSEFVAAIMNWLPEFSAFFLSFNPAPREKTNSGSKERNSQTDLVEFEQGLSERALSLVCSLLRLMTTEHTPSYSRPMLRTKYLTELCGSIVKLEK